MGDIISASSLDTVGLETAVCDVNNIKKARYTLQVISVVLMKELGDAFEEDKSGSDDDTTFDNWVSIQTPLFLSTQLNISVS